MICLGQASEKNHGGLVIQMCTVLVMTWDDDHFIYMFRLVEGQFLWAYVKPSVTCLRVKRAIQIHFDLI